MSKFNFDGENRLIYLLAPNTSFDVLELYAEWKQWAADPINLRYPPALRSLGGETLTPTKTIAPYIEVLDPWKIKPWNPGVGNSYTLSVQGNLFGTGGIFPFVHPDEGSVMISLELSANALAVSMDTSVLDQINIKLDRLLDIEEGDWAIVGTQMIFYARDGTELMRFNLYDKLGRPADDNIYRRERV